MVAQVTTELVDDLDGSPADETVTFGLDGKTYAIDLSAANANKLRAALHDYIAAARTNRKRPTSKGSAPAAFGPKRSAGRSAEQNQAIREWAKEMGREVSDRGRLPNQLVHDFTNRATEPTQRSRRSPRR